MKLRARSLQGLLAQADRGSPENSLETATLGASLARRHVEGGCRYGRVLDPVGSRCAFKCHSPESSRR